MLDITVKSHYVMFNRFFCNYILWGQTIRGGGVPLIFHCGGNALVGGAEMLDSALEMTMGMGFPMGMGIPWDSHGNGNW